MPTERFLRLSLEKQDRIMAASEREFSEHPIESISINRIIRDAGISRGSFYTYFLDKRDVFMYILERRKQREAELIKAWLLENGFDISAMLDKLICYYRDQLKEKLEDIERFESNISSGFFDFEDIKSLCRDDSDPLSEWMWEHMGSERKRYHSFNLFKAAVIHFKLICGAMAMRLVMEPEEESRTMETFHDMVRIFIKGVENVDE